MCKRIVVCNRGKKLDARSPYRQTNVALVPPPGLFSSVFIHTVHQVIVQGNKIADKCCRAQAQALSPWQEHLEVTVEVQVLLTVLSRYLNLP